MQDIDKHLDDIKEMRQLMDRSTRFLSLSGLSGVAAGVFALIGAGLAFFWVNYNWGSRIAAYQGNEAIVLDMQAESFIQLTAIATGVLVAALSSALLLTWRKVKRDQGTLFTPASKRMLTAMLIPLVSGGLFCILLMYHGAYAFVAPATLIFYGLGCVSAGQYTLSEIKYLGMFNIGLGLLNAFFIGYGILFWSIGFGLLHIFYGLLMYMRYDRKANA